MSEAKFEKAGKTIRDLLKLHEEWIWTFRRGAAGDQRAYEKARVERKKFEEEKWVPLALLDEATKDLFANACSGCFDEDECQGEPPTDVRPEFCFRKRLEKWFKKPGI